MKESESKQEACGLDMAQGLHVPNYPQKFIRAPQSQHPSKSPSNGKACNPSKIMSEVCHAK